ncbi:MAG: hypothetical protein V3U54_12770 [Thermodesulfobacteriota bacterium]
MNSKRKPDKREYHAGCLLHDDQCLDEQLKAGCTVDLFICFNCRDLYENGELEAIIKASKAVLNLFNIIG